MERSRTRLTAVVAAGVALVASLGLAPTLASGATGDGDTAVVVTAGSVQEAAERVERFGGVVDRELELIEGVAATIAAPAAEELAQLADVRVVADEPVAFQATREATTSQVNAVRDQVDVMNPPEWWDAQAGAGVGVALVDTGVAEHPGLDGRVIHGPDYSDEGDGIDRYGHGTFMAGLIAGADTGTDEGPTGLAPGAHVVSVKVAGEDGVTTLSTVLDAIGWVVTHQEDHGIRVLNLSIGVRTMAAPESDPLVAAVQAAWSSGLTVVTPSGNYGADEVTSPGRDPWAITVGAVGASDGVSVPDWSGHGRVSREHQPDVLAPGVSVVSLRAEDSTADVEHPEARVGEDHFRGSGTSMSVGLVSGAVATLLEHRQWATPDDVKGALVDTSQPVDGARAGLVDLAGADEADASDDWNQRHPISFKRPPGYGGNQMPWADRDAPGPETTWQRIRWMDDEWQRIRWMDGQWQRIRWMDDGEWQRIRWMDDGEWQRIRWMDDEWQRIRWMEANFARIRWMDTNFARIRWMEDDWQRIRWMDDGWGDEAWTANEWDATIWADQSAP